MIFRLATLVLLSGCSVLPDPQLTEALRDLQPITVHDPLPLVADSHPPQASLLPPAAPAHPLATAATEESNLIQRLRLLR